MAVPRKIGSFEDKKFREALARLLFTGRRTLFDRVELSNGGTGSPRNIMTKDFASSLFKRPGDTIFFSFHGKSEVTIFTKGITLTVFDRDSSKVSYIVGEYNVVPADITNEERPFYGEGRLVYLGNNQIRGSGYLIVDQAGAPPPLVVTYEDTVTTFTSQILTFSLDSYSLDGGADKVKFGLLKAEFSPGVED